MLDTGTVYQVLKDHARAIKSQINLDEWEDFSRRMSGLASQFKAITGQEDPERASADLEVLTNDLLDICWGYAHIAGLLDQAEESWEEGPGRRFPSPALPEMWEVRETANRYYDLLAGLAQIPGPDEDQEQTDQEHAENR